jgi:hypothetical protein
MTQSLLDRYDKWIAGVLSCYDRVVITGTGHATRVFGREWAE